MGYRDFGGGVGGGLAFPELLGWDCRGGWPTVGWKLKNRLM